MVVGARRSPRLSYGVDFVLNHQSDVTSFSPISFVSLNPGGRSMDMQIEGSSRLIMSLALVLLVIRAADAGSLVCRATPLTSFCSLMSSF